MTRWLLLALTALLSSALFSAVAGEFAAGNSQAVAAKTQPGFPRLGGMLIGNPHNYDNASYQKKIARFDLAILGMYNGWSGAKGESPADVVAALKSRNSALLLGNYTVMTEVPHDLSDTATAYKRDKLAAGKGPNGIGDWWAYNSAGQHTDWSGGAYGAWDTNLTLLTTPDADGFHWPEWLARGDYQHVLQGAGFDIWYCDNNFWRPRSAADWGRDGTNDDPDSIPVRNFWRNGQRAYYDTAKTIAPNLRLMVNADSDLDGSLFPPGADRFTQYAGTVPGAFMEHAMGVSWSVETWGGWSLMMAWYHHLRGNLLSPQFIVFDVFLPSTTDYQSLRYALASCLMDNGYFSASTDYHQVIWFDEYDLAGTSTTHWLGKAMEPPPSVPWQNGVYRRRFEHGLALVNPKGNGAQSVTLAPGYRRFLGRQAPMINNGKSVTTLTLKDRDGILLISQ